MFAAHRSDLKGVQLSATRNSGRSSTASTASLPSVQALQLQLWKGRAHPRATRRTTRNRSAWAMRSSSHNGDGGGAAHAHGSAAILHARSSSPSKTVSGWSGGVSYKPRGSLSPSTEQPPDHTYLLSEIRPTGTARSSSPAANVLGSNGLIPGLAACVALSKAQQRASIHASAPPSVRQPSRSGSPGTCKDVCGDCHLQHKLNAWAASSYCKLDPSRPSTPTSRPGTPGAASRPGTAKATCRPGTARTTAPTATSRPDSALTVRSLSPTHVNPPSPDHTQVVVVRARPAGDQSPTNRDKSRSVSFLLFTLAQGPPGGAVDTMRSF
jgi:hypothetical protein